MLRNYLLITWRNLKRNPVYLGINILGLSIGIAASLLIWQYVVYEKSYDAFFPKKDQVFRVRLDRYNNGELNTEWAAGCSVVGRSLTENFPEALAYTKMHHWEVLITYQDKVFRESDAYMATASIFDMFSLDVLAGEPQQRMKEPNTLVLAESVARKYFGEADPIGKRVKVSNTGELEVVGVIADLPPNTHFDFDILISHPTLVNIYDEEMESAWWWDGFYTYVELERGTNPAGLAEKFNAYVAETERENLELYNHRMDFSFQPLTSIHLTSDLLYEFQPNGDAKTVAFMSLIGVLILLIAWINYINLSTARASDRGKEVGVRKTNGATRKQLIAQFLFDAVILNLISALLGLTGFQLGRSFLNQLAGIPNSFVLWDNPWFFSIFLGVILVGALLSGLYPALVLSSFNPIQALKGQLKMGKGALKRSFSKIQLRRGLVVLQFAASILLIAATFTIYRQLRFMQAQEKGLALDQVVVLKGPVSVDSTFNNKMASFLQQVMQIPGVKGTATSSTVPGIMQKNNAGGIRLWGADESEAKEYDRQFINPQYLNLFDIEIAEGVNFSAQAFHDSNFVIVNEAAVKHLGFQSPGELIGKDLNVWGDRLTVKGVIKDYFHRSLKNHPIPSLYLYHPYCIAYQSIKIQESSLASALPEIQQGFEATFPGNPYEYFFADENYEQLYKAEKISGSIFTIFSLLAVGIACLGLFGLVSYSLGRRTREIGIRKVLGATHAHIFRLLMRDFSYLVIFAGLIAIPFTFWLIQTWLKDYPYRIKLQPDLFILPIGIVAVIALLTVLRSTLVSANSKPIDSLRAE